jgi:hypothetical protein
MRRVGSKQLFVFLLRTQTRARVKIKGRSPKEFRYNGVEGEEKNNSLHPSRILGIAFK